jgi:hypothetical protein
MNSQFKPKRKFFILFPITIFFVIGAAVMLLWNWLMPAIFGLVEISYWQSLGLLALCRILFGSFGFGKHQRPPFANNQFKESMMNMTDEEKQKFKEEWKQRCK